jgi:hypothetical protein
MIGVGIGGTRADTAARRNGGVQGRGRHRYSSALHGLGLDGLVSRLKGVLAAECSKRRKFSPQDAGVLSTLMMFGVRVGVTSRARRARRARIAIALFREPRTLHRLKLNCGTPSIPLV